MKKLLAFFILLIYIGPLSAQYYSISEWIKNIPFPSCENEAYAIGISDPRMEDKSLAKDIAIQRAISMAVLFSESEVNYLYDYFEKQSEEYRLLSFKEDIQEIGKISASAYVDESSFSVINYEINKNDETIVLIKFTYDKLKKANFFVDIEYYRQDFEISDARHYETLKNLKQETKWEKGKDTISTSYNLMCIDSDINTEIYYNNIKITLPGYYYQYQATLPENFDLKSFKASVSLLKGLWIAYLDSFTQSALNISKNHNTKLKTVSDNYKLNNNDEILETHKSSLSRFSGKNTLSFAYGGIGVYKNQLYPKLYLIDEINLYNNIESNDNHDKKKDNWLKRFFRNKKS